MSSPHTDLAAARAGLYGWLAGVLGRMPDAELAAALHPDAMEPLLRALSRMSAPAAQEAAAALRRSVDELAAAPGGHAALIERWAIDRTRLMRQTPGKHLPPPYESLYKKHSKGKEDSSVILAVQTFYRQLDICPQDACEAPDFLPMELDFLAALCRAEAKAEEAEAARLRAAGKAFLSRHVGAWAAEYCKQALVEAKTDLFRAVLLLLPEILALDEKFLEETQAV